LKFLLGHPIMINSATGKYLYWILRDKPMEQERVI
jgi:hypothetical protein